MKVTPDLYSVSITKTGSGYGQKTEEEFVKAQLPYSALNFLTLSEFDADHKYTPDLITEGELVISGGQMVELSCAGIEFKVRQRVDIEVDITQQIMDLANKPLSIITKDAGDTNYNTMCEVHIPNISMLMYNELLLKEDVCTDELQSELNCGWRIIAACPQPDKRRPDYILGRFNPEMDGSSSAKR